MVGDTARRVYGGSAGILIEYEPGLGEALRQTAELMARGPDRPIFEANLEHAGVLVRLDVLLPAGSAWRIVEVKSTTSLKEEHLADCAIQAWVFEGAGGPHLGRYPTVRETPGPVVLPHRGGAGARA